MHWGQHGQNLTFKNLHKDKVEDGLEGCSHQRSGHLLENC